MTWKLISINIFCTINNNLLINTHQYSPNYPHILSIYKYTVLSVLILIELQFFLSGLNQKFSYFILYFNVWKILIGIMLNI